MPHNHTDPNKKLRISTNRLLALLCAVSLAGLPVSVAVAKNDEKAKKSEESKKSDKGKKKKKKNKRKVIGDFESHKGNHDCANANKQRGGDGEGNGGANNGGSGAGIDC